jgi:hypothetical protein
MGSSVIRSVVAVALAMLLGMARALALDFGSGALPIAFEPDQAFSLTAGGRLVIDGTVDGGKAVTVVLRIDDDQSLDYASRLNNERTLPPGPFSIALDVALLRAENGRALDVTRIRRIIFFAVGQPETSGQARVTRFTDMGAAAAPPAQPSVVQVPAAIPAAAGFSFGTGSLPIAFEPATGTMLATGGRIVVEGTIEGAQPVAVVLRIDDETSRDYASRMNAERVLPPGPFALTFDVASLRAENGRALQAANIRRIILFTLANGRARVTRFAIEGGTASGQPVVQAPVQTPPKQTPIGFSFGTGSLPIAFEPAAPVTFDPAGHIDIAGVVEGTAPVTIVFRVDDGTSTSYATRMNDERTLAPGPFATRIAVADLRTTDGRTLDPTDIRRVILFVVGPGSARATHFVLTGAASVTAQSAGAPAATIAAPAARLSLGSGTLPIAFEPDAPVALPVGTIEIAGTVTSKTPINLVLRIDDLAAPDYMSRLNDERTLPPGPFQIRIDTRTLKTSGGRPLNPSRIHRVVLFVAGVGGATVSRFDVVGAGAQPTAVVAPQPAPAPSAVPAQPSVEIIPAAPATPSQAAPGRPRTLGAGSLPLKFEPGSPTAFGDSDEIIVEGTVNGTAPAALALRIDDAGSVSYPTRYNDERMIPPGPFRFTVGLKGLKTPSGRVLDPNKIARVILFAWQGSPQVTIARFETSRAASLPGGSKGYSFGALDAPLPPGFERIGPADPRLTGRGPITAVRRPAPDPIVANGLRGVRRVVLPASPGRVRVTVWTEDPGEWDLLPHPLDRQIKINGLDLVVEKWGADAWIAQRYLRGARAEHTDADDAWTAYGSKRGEPRSIDVDAGREGVAIDITGADNAAYYLSAVLIEPIEPSTAASQQVTAGRLFVDAQRAAWYRSTLPVAPMADEPADGTVALTQSWNQPPDNKMADSKPAPIRQRAAPGTGVALKLALTSDRGLARPRVSVDPPARNGIKLPARIWGAQARLERDDTVLRLKSNRLLADTTGLALAAGSPRGYEVWIDVPAGTAPGVYSGALVVADANSSRARSYPIEITVLAVTLPPVAKPAGFYLARAAHLAYFPGLAIERERQAECDLDVLRGFGLTNTAPPIGGLERNDLGVFANDMRRAGRAGIAPGWLIYNPLHDLVAAQGAARASDIVARLEEMIRAQGLPQPVWSVADEPSNADQSNAGLADFVKQLRAKSRGVRLAGHLNTPVDEKFAPLFDTLLLNPGFGIDAAPLDRLRKSGKDVWIYNTFAPRQTAGLWLWRSAAQRYVQWHARLPTADPFDPLDGREADFQMLYPSADVCPKQPDIHRDLLRMAEGVVDQRWLLWLDQNPAPAAKAVAAEIRSRLPGPFADARRLGRADLEAIRNRIMDLLTQ